METVRERQIPYDFIHMWNLRNETNDQRKRERETPRNRPLTIENNLMITRGEMDGGWVKWVIGIKKPTYPDEH